MTKVEFQKACLEAGIQLNEEQMNQFEKYMQPVSYTHLTLPTKRT